MDYLRIAATATAGGGAAAPAAPVELGALGATATLSRSAGARFNASASTNLTLSVEGGADFDQIDLWLTATGADRTLTLNGAIQRPSDSAVTFPATIAAGKGARLKFERHGATWMLITLVKSYTL
jgi:hypothetical protein